MGGTLHTGARVALRLRIGSADPVIYDGTIEEPDAEHVLVVTLAGPGEDPALGEVSTTPAGAPAPPEWALGWLATLARQAGRTAKKTGAWPRKIRQWKAPPDGAG